MMQFSKGEVEPTLEEVLERASSGNEILIAHSDGSVYTIRKLRSSTGSAFDDLGIPHIENDLTVDEIVGIIRAGRQRVWDAEIKGYREGPWANDDDTI